MAWNFVDLSCRYVCGLDILLIGCFAIVTSELLSSFQLLPELLVVSMSLKHCAPAPVLRPTLPLKTVVVVSYVGCIYPYMYLSFLVSSLTYHQSWIFILL